MNPKFLEDHFPHLKAGVMKRKYGTIEKDTAEVAPISSSPVIVASNTQTPTPNPVVSVNTSSLQVSKQVPKPITSSIPISFPHTSQSYHDAHVDKKVKFGSNRWANSLNITISESEESESDSGHAKNMSSTPNGKSDVSALPLSEQIRILREKINRAEKSGSQSPRPSTPNTPPEKDKDIPQRVIPTAPRALSSSQTTIIIPTRKEVKASSIALSSSPPELISSHKSLDENKASDINNKDVMYQSQIDGTRKLMEYYLKDKETIIKEKENHILQLKSINMDKIETELQALKIELEKKMKEHIEKSVAVATIKAKLEAVEVREKAIDEFIIDTKKTIDSLNKKKAKNLTNRVLNFSASSPIDTNTTRSNATNSSVTPITLDSNVKLPTMQTQVKFSDNPTSNVTPDLKKAVEDKTVAIAKDEESEPECSIVGVSSSDNHVSRENGMVFINPNF